MITKLFILIAVMSSTLAANADIQTKQVTADYFYVSGQKYTKQPKTDVVVVVEDISNGTGECAQATRKANTVVGLTVVSDTTWMGVGSSYAGDTERRIYQATVSGCLTKVNRTMQYMAYKIPDALSTPKQEIVTLEFEQDSLKVKSAKVEFKAVSSGNVYESLSVKLD